LYKTPFSALVKEEELVNVTSELSKYDYVLLQTVIKTETAKEETVESSQEYEKLKATIEKNIIAKRLELETKLKETKKSIQGDSPESRPDKLQLMLEKNLNLFKLVKT